MFLYQLIPSTKANEAVAWIKMISFLFVKWKKYLLNKYKITYIELNHLT